MSLEILRIPLSNVLKVSRMAHSGRVGKNQSEKECSCERHDSTTIRQKDRTALTAPGLRSLRRLDEHGRPVGQHFRDALHHFGRVVTGADHGVATQFSSVLQHQVKSLGAGFLA